MIYRKNEAAYMGKQKRWQIKVQKDGDRKTFYSSIEGKKGKIACEKKADRWLEGEVLDSNIRFGKAYDLFLDEKKKLTGTANWKKLEGTYRIWIKPSLEHLKVSSITKKHLQDVLFFAFDKGLSKKYIEGIRGSMSTFATFAKKNKWDFCGTEFVTVPKGAPVVGVKILQPQELDSLFEGSELNANEFYIHAYRFAVLTGARKGEICGLMNSDVEGRVAHIRRAFNSLSEMTEGKTANAQRSMALCDKAIKVLEDQKAMLRRKGIISPYTFPGKDGNISSPPTFYGNWYRYRTKIGCQSSLHALRHTLISYASSTVPEALLKKTVGHSKSMNTGQYIHTVDDEAILTAELLNKRFKEIL